MRTEVAKLDANVFKLEHKLKISQTNNELISKMESKVGLISFWVYDNWPRTKWRRLAEQSDHKNILLSPEPSCPNPHFVTKSVTKSLRRNRWFAVSWPGSSVFYSGRSWKIKHDVLKMQHANFFLNNIVVLYDLLITLLVTCGRLQDKHLAEIALNFKRRVTRSFVSLRSDPLTVSLIFSYLNVESNLSLYSLYYAEACKRVCWAHLRVIASGQHSSF